MTVNFSKYLQWRILGHNLSVSGVAQKTGIGRKAIYGHMQGQYPRTAHLELYAKYFGMKDEHELDKIWREWKEPKGYEFPFPITAKQSNPPGRPAKTSAGTRKTFSIMIPVEVYLPLLKESQRLGIDINTFIERSLTEDLGITSLDGPTPLKPPKTPPTNPMRIDRAPRVSPGKTYKKASKPRPPEVED